MKRVYVRSGKQRGYENKVRVSPCVRIQQIISIQKLPIDRILVITVSMLEIL